MWHCETRRLRARSVSIQPVSPKRISVKGLLLLVAELTRPLRKLARYLLNYR
jgi:hypothetical protein